MKIKILLWIGLFLSIFIKLSAQHSEPSTLEAFRINQKINFDGKLNEPFWQLAQKISNFTQTEPNYNQPISEKTQVAVVYNEKGLYFGVWCFVKEKKSIIAKSLSVDFDFFSEDNFRIMLSPFNDNKTGYLFVINPLGARADMQIYGFEDANPDWNGVWDAKTTITDSGWFAEVYIPFNTLQFKKDTSYVWALNFERDIMAKNEQALWQGWSRDKSIFSVSEAGKLIGLKNIKYAHKFEFKPYTLLGYQFDRDEGTTFPIKFGGDLNINLTPSLKLNLTSFTDFAQVEVDRIPVNLSRFNVYYPEKRQFFLEGSNYFDFYLGSRNQAFYSRQIGIENLQQVPIYGGIRLFGKIKKLNIGMLSMQEAPIDTVPTTNNSVFRYKYEIGKQSYIGTIFTNKANANGSNQVVGFDAVYSTSELWGNKNLVLGAKIATSMENFEKQDKALTYNIFFDYPNDLIDNFMAFNVMEENFDPQLGFIYRSNYDAYSWYFRIMPRWFKSLGVRKLLLKPWGFTIYKTHSTGELESIYNETRPLGAVFNSGDRFEVNFIQNFDRLDEEFFLTENISIPEGKYFMYKTELQLESYRGRKIWFFSLYRWGDFYTGKINTFNFELGWNISKNLNWSNEYTYNAVYLPQGNVFTNEIASYLNLAFTTKLNISIFAQYNDLENVMIYNIRLHWIPKIGSDFYFVITTGYDEPINDLEILKPQTSAVVGKFVYRITF